MRVLALAWLGVTVAGCGGTGVFACAQAEDCGASGVCEANGFCSFPDAGCPSQQRYGEHAPDGVAGACVEPLADTSSGGTDPGTTTGTTLPMLTAATLEGGGSSSSSEDSSSSGERPTSTTDAIDDGKVESSSSGGGPTTLGPIVIDDDLDDGAMYPTSGPDMGLWMPSGEEPGYGFAGEFPAGERYYAYLRFTLPEALPTDASIESVTLEMFGHAIYFWDRGHALRVWAQDDADAAQIAGLADYPGMPDGVALLDASVPWGDDDMGLAWEIPGPNISPELAPLVQELVDTKGGLAAGAHIQFWIAEDVLDGMGEEVGWFDSFAGPETAPRLTVTFE